MCSQSLRYGQTNRQTDVGFYGSLIILVKMGKISRKEDGLDTHIHRIRAITFREARDEGATFISRSWIATRIGRSEDFVKKNW